MECIGENKTKNQTRAPPFVGLLDVQSRDLKSVSHVQSAIPHSKGVCFLSVEAVLKRK